MLCGEIQVPNLSTAIKGDHRFVYVVQRSIFSIVISPGGASWQPITSPRRTEIPTSMEVLTLNLSMARG